MWKSLWASYVEPAPWQNLAGRGLGGAGPTMEISHRQRFGVRRSDQEEAGPDSASILSICTDLLFLPTTNPSLPVESVFPYRIGGSEASASSETPIPGSHPAQGETECRLLRCAFSAFAAPRPHGSIPQDPASGCGRGSEGPTRHRLSRCEGGRTPLIA